MNLRWNHACGLWLCKMKGILSISIPSPLFSLLLVAAWYANISSSNLKLSVNCHDDRSPLYTGPAQCGCSVLEGKQLHTKGLSHPMEELGGTPSNFPFQETTKYMQFVPNNTRMV